MTWTAVVLAGSRPGGDSFAEQFGAGMKALIPVGGEPMVRRPVAALLASEAIGKILVLSQAPDQVAAVLPSNPRVQFGESKGTIAETLLALIEENSVDWPLLITTADHALLDPATVGEFCTASGIADIAIGVVERKVLLDRFPNAKRTWIAFRRGAYTGANLFALRSPDVTPAIALWRSVEQERKKGWRVLTLLGPVTLAGVALRLIGLDGALNRLSRKLGLSLRAVPLSNPLAGVDVDKIEDHRLVEAVLEGRA